MINTIVSIVLAFNIVMIETLLLYGIYKKQQVKRINKKLNK